MNDLLVCLRLFVFSLFVCSGCYSAMVLGFAAMVAPESRRGSLLKNADGEIVGSSLLAQNFTREEYFWARPSAVNYDASATGGSNLSPTNPKLSQVATEIIANLKISEDQLVPVDLVSMSGSGVDPHITLEAAHLQANRVAQARNLPVEIIEQMLRERADSPTLAALGGEPLINVLETNIALDQLKPRNR